MVSHTLQLEFLAKSQERLRCLRRGLDALQRRRNRGRCADTKRSGQPPEAEPEKEKALKKEIEGLKASLRAAEEAQSRKAAIQHSPAEARNLEIQYGDEHAGAMLASLCEELVLARENLRVLRSDIGDKINDFHAQHAALKEAYGVERGHLATLTTNLNDSIAALSKLQEEKLAHQQVFADDLMRKYVEVSAERNAKELSTALDTLRKSLTLNQHDDTASCGRVAELEAEVRVLKKHLAVLQLSRCDVETRRMLQTPSHTSSPSATPWTATASFTPFSVVRSIRFTSPMDTPGKTRCPICLATKSAKGLQFSAATFKRHLPACPVYRAVQEVEKKARNSVAQRWALGWKSATGK